MITQEVFVRENKTYVLEHGTKEDGVAIIRISPDERDVEFDQPIRYIPVRMSAVFNENGECQPIVTSWRKQVISNNGKVLKAEPLTDDMITNQLDMIIFVAGLGSHIAKSIINGWVRCIKGFNTQPVFAPDGSRIPDTVFMKNADGTDMLDESGNPVVDVENSYDTTLPPSNDYYPQPIVEEPIVEETPTEPTPDEPTV
jgi:hypothetical protein